MLSFKHIFHSRQHALEVYKNQLSKQTIYVESFESFPAGTEVVLDLQNMENRRSIRLNATVDHAISKAEAMELNYGQRPGLILRVNFTPEIIEPLRALFLAREPSYTEMGNADAAQSNLPETEKIDVPLENLNSLSNEDATIAVNAYFEVVSNGSLFQLFNLSPDADRKTLRSVYNKLVRVLHPDRHSSAFDDALISKLEDAYQIVNEAYEILQNHIKNAIYLEASRNNDAPNGMSLSSYKKFISDYRLKNADKISLANELVKSAEKELAAGNKGMAEQNIHLAVQYDPYNELARTIMK